MARDSTLEMTPSLQNVVKGPAAQGRLRALSDNVRAGARLLIAALDQQPLRLRARARALEGKPAA
jgi:hypothetical protein